MRGKNKIIIYYPSYEKGGIAKVLINLVNFFAKRILKFFYFHKMLIKKNLKTQNVLRL